jgi:hypothetical protein
MSIAGVLPILGVAAIIAVIVVSSVLKRRSMRDEGPPR